MRTSRSHGDMGVQRSRFAAVQAIEYIALGVDVKIPERISRGPLMGSDACQGRERWGQFGCCRPTQTRGRFGDASQRLAGWPGHLGGTGREDGTEGRCQTSCSFAEG
jgi:hypothetical protein